MTERGRVNAAASVRQRLINLAKRREEEPELVFVLYAIERFLHRLAASPHADRFVLKGAILMLAWKGASSRPTRDLDLLGFGEITPGTVEKMLTDILGATDAIDGVIFDLASMRIAPIREGREYEGLRVTFDARLVTAIIPCQVDIGVGDAITPGPQTIEFPSLLDMPTTRLRAYPRETVVAEKTEAMVTLGIANSRMKDYHDLWTLATGFEFDADRLASAIRATFRRRGTAVPVETPLGLTSEFLADTNKQSQWRAFVRRARLSDSLTLGEVGAAIAAFLRVPLEIASRPEAQRSAHWPAGGPWRV